MSTHFHAIEFLTALRNLYDKAVMHDGRDLVLDLECLAFMRLVQARTRKVLEPIHMHLFRLFDDLTLSPPLPDLVVEYEGQKYLRLDCLADTPSSSLGPPEPSTSEAGTINKSPGNIE